MGRDTMVIRVGYRYTPDYPLCSPGKGEILAADVNEEAGKLAKRIAIGAIHQRCCSRVNFVEMNLNDVEGTVEAFALLLEDSHRSH